MDQNLIAKLLSQFRGAQADPTLSQPPMPGVNQAGSLNAPPQNPFMPNQGLEQAATQQGNTVPLHPLLRSIMTHMGLLNMIRNRDLQPMIDPNQP